MSNLKIDPKQTTPIKDNVSINDVMELLKKQGEEIQGLRKENEVLTQKMDPGFEIRESRKKYEGPRQYSYGIINGKPIVSWKTIKDDQYQDPYTKKWVSRQEMEIQYFDGTKEIFDIVPYGQLLKRSEKMFAKEIKQLGSKTFLTFEKDGQDFEIELTFINP